MPQVMPPADFSRAKLRIHTVPAGQTFGRIYLARYPDPLGFGKTPSRFSDPRRRSANNRFGVLYLGETVKVCFLEAYLRDRRDGLIGELTIPMSDFYDRHYAEIITAAPLKLVDLRDDAAIVMGVPTDVAKASRQTLGRRWSVAFHEHSSVLDGIIYPSRLNGHTNLAIYDRAIPKLTAGRVRKLIAAPGLADVLDDLQVVIAEPDPN